MSTAWIVSLVVLVLFMWGGFKAYRKRWPSTAKNKQQVGAGPTPAPVIPPGPAPTPSAPSTGSGGPDVKKWFARIGKVILIIAGILLGVWTVFWLFGLLLSGIHSIYSGGSETVRSPASVATRIVPSSATIGPETAQTGCQFFKRERQVCTLHGKTRIMLEPGTPGGLHLCWTPRVDAPDTPEKDRVWKSIKSVFMSGDPIEYDPANPPDGLYGYEFTPLRDGLVIAQWLSDSPDCS